jgi:hypothetical protein
MKDTEVRIKSDEELRQSLGEEGYRIVREKGTERAFTGRYWNSKTPGLYRCSVCSNPLFASVHQIRFRQRLAQLLAAGGPRAREGRSGSQSRHGAHRGAVRPLQGASGTCVPRWASAHRIAVLHQFGVAGVGPEYLTEEGALSRCRLPQRLFRS